MTITSTHLYQEIYQQPKMLEALLTAESKNIEKVAKAINDLGARHIVIAARGTSDNAGRYAQYLLGAKNGLLVSLATPSLFSVYKQPPDLSGTVVIGISQSGKSPDIVAVVEEARKQGALTIAITNQSGSDLNKAAEYAINLNAGTEVSVAATKTYTTELMAIAMLSAELAKDEQSKRELKKLPQALEVLLLDQDKLDSRAERYRYMQHCVVIGRGYHYASAFEFSLKLKELTYTKAEPYSSADFQHGPFALLEPGFPVMLFAAKGPMLEETREFAERASARGAELIVISNDEKILSMAELAIELPADLPEWLTPILAIVPAQIFAMYLAYARKIDIDSPRGIKKVTETT